MYECGKLKKVIGNKILYRVILEQCANFLQKSPLPNASNQLKIITASSIVLIVPKNLVKYFLKELHNSLLALIVTSEITKPYLN